MGIDVHNPGRAAPSGAAHGTVILPAYDEAARLPTVLGGIASCDLGLEIVVIDDGSRDETAAVARTHGVTVISHPLNLGYGAALQTGYKYALRTRTPFLVQMDADGQHDPAQIPLLLEPLLRGDGDLVVGSRFAEARGYEMGAFRSMGRGVMTGLARLAGLQVTDPTSGFQAMNRAMLERYVSVDFPPGLSRRGRPDSGALGRMQGRGATRRHGRKRPRVHAARRHPIPLLRV